MFSRKLSAEQTPSEAEVLYGKDAGTAWAARTAPAAAPPVADVTPLATESTESVETLPPVERTSYRILRGRIEPLSKLRLISRQGEKALVDYGCISWVNARSPGELVLRV